MLIIHLQWNPAKMPPAKEPILSRRQFSKEQISFFLHFVNPTLTQILLKRHFLSSTKIGVIDWFHCISDHLATGNKI